MVVVVQAPRVQLVKASQVVVITPPQGSLLSLLMMVLDSLLLTYEVLTVLMVLKVSKDLLALLVLTL